MKSNEKYLDIKEDYYYNMGYKDGKKGSEFWSMISLTAGFLLAFEFSRSLFLNRT